MDYNDIPLKRYYRYLVHNAESDQVVFYNLPTNHIYTMNVEGPFKWNIQTYKSLYDLDNLSVKEESLQATKGVIHAEYMIKNLLVDGMSCW